VDNILEFFKKSTDAGKFNKEFSDFLAFSFNWLESFKKNSPSNNKDNEDKELFESIYHFIHKKFRGTKVNNFGEEVFKTCSFELKKALLLNYFKSFFCNYLNSLCMQCTSLNINCDMIVEQRNEIFKRMSVSNHEFDERKPLHEMVTFVLDGNFGLVNKIIKEKIMKPLECYIYEQTWIFKGKIQGNLENHSEFFKMFKIIRD